MVLRHALILGSIVLIGDTAAAQDGTEPRARRPSFSQVDVDAIFFADALQSVLNGEWPDPSSRPPALATTSTEEVPGSATSGNMAGVSDWLTAEQLIDEITLLARTLHRSTRSPRRFAGETRAEAQRDFYVAACLFKWLSQWDGNVRFHSQSAAASGHLLQAAQAISSSDGTAFPTAKLAADNLTELIRGNRVFDESSAGPSWSLLADRSQLMWRIELAVEETLDDCLASDTKLQRRIDEANRAVHLTSALFAAIRQDGAADADQPEYLSFCRATERQLEQLHRALGKSNLREAQNAWQLLKASCNDCHEAFR